AKGKRTTDERGSGDEHRQGCCATSARDSPHLRSSLLIGVRPRIPFLLYVPVVQLMLGSESRGVAACSTAVLEPTRDAARVQRACAVRKSSMGAPHWG